MTLARRDGGGTPFGPQSLTGFCAPDIWTPLGMAPSESCKGLLRSPCQALTLPQLCVHRHRTSLTTHPHSPHEHAARARTHTLTVSVQAYTYTVTHVLILIYTHASCHTHIYTYPHPSEGGSTDPGTRLPVGSRHRHLPQQACRHVPTDMACSGMYVPILRTHT